MYPPILPGRRNRSDEENTDWEERLDDVGRGYEGSPWLTALVNFSGFLAAFAGSLAALFTVANLDNGTVWVPYATVLAVLVGTHLCLRAERYRRRRVRQLAARGGRSAIHGSRPSAGHR